MKLRKDKWEQKKLGEISTIIMGQSPPSSTYNEVGEGLPFFQGKTEFTEKHPVAVKWCSKPNKIAEPNDILITVRAPVGATNIANQRCCIGRGIAAIRSKESNEFILTYLQSVEKELSLKGTGTIFGGISGKVLLDLPIPLPPLEEQKQIAALFQSIETAMEQVDGQEKNLKALRKSLINKLTKQKPKFGNLLTKSNYKEYSIGDLAVEVPDRTDNPQKTGIEKFIGLEDFESGELTIQRFSSTEKLVSAMKLCKKGDVLFARRNAYLKRASLTDFDAVCSGDVIVMRAKEKIILPKFLILIMNTDEFWEFAISNAAGTMSKRVKWRDLAAYSLELPDIKIQEKILEVFNQLEATLTQLKQQKTTLKNLKQKLLNEILG